jgi:signal transduction histidine kinase/ligand-binding sensor domain-containing protein
VTTRYSVSSWSAKDGVSGVVTALTQDRDGYLWIGTNEGLFRFDGVRFVRWDGRLLAGYGVGALAPDRDGSLWVGFFGNGALSRIADGSVENFGPSHGLPDGYVNAILQDSAGSLWVGARGGLSRRRGHQWERIAFDGTTQVNVLDIHERDGRVWVTTSLGLYSGDKAAVVLTPIVASADPSADRHAVASAQWVTATSGAVVTLLPIGLPPVARQLPSLNVARLLEDRRGYLWIAARGQGLLRASSQAGRAVLDPIAGIGLTDDIRALFADREGNVWVGSNRGLDRVTETAVLAVTPQSAEFTLPIRGLTTTQDGSVWVGTPTGLFRFYAGGSRRYGSTDGVPDGFVSALHVDYGGALNVAVRGANEIVRRSGTRFEPVEGQTAAFRQLLALVSDQAGNAWISDGQQGVLKVSHTSEMANRSVFDARTYAMTALADRRGRLWFGFDDGSVGLVDGKRRVLFGREAGLVGDMAGTLYEDDDGHVWVGTNGGLSLFEDDKFLTLPGGQSRFPVSNVRAIVSDGDGYLWVGVSMGVLRMHPKEFRHAVSDPSYQPQYFAYGLADGIPGGTYLAVPAAVRDRTGRLWFARSNGIAIIDPARVTTHAETIPVRIEQAVAHGHIVSTADPIALSSNLASLQIDYTSLSFAGAEKIRFLYRIDGFDSDWVDAGTRRQAFYTNLGPGEYRFRVTCMKDGIKCGSEASWKFTIKPTFYQTRAFTLLVIGLVGVSVWGAWQIRHRQIHQRMALVFNERARVGRELHDTLLQSLIGIGLQCEEIARKIESPETARQQLERVSRRVATDARDARHSIMNLRSPALVRDDLPTVLRAAGERLTSGSDVAFECQVTGVARTLAPDREEHLLKIAQEAIANAVRHASARHVRVELAYGDPVRLRVVDDGCGLPASEYRMREHWGLRTMEERAKQIGGSFQLTSAPGAGTQVLVLAPTAAPV